MSCIIYQHLNKSIKSWNDFIERDVIALPQKVYPPLAGLSAGIVAD
jgi:hypothetical protein